MLCAHINVRSLLNNFDLFREHILDNNYSVVAISESWLSSNISDNVVKINNYSFVRQDRVGRGGGVGLYVHNDFDCVILFTECVDSIEHLWVKLKNHNETIIVGVIYRPPKGNFNEFISKFEDILIECYSQYDKLLCLGDFNINMLNLESNYVNRLCNIFETFGLNQLINEPTRVSHNTANLIDLILYNSDNVADFGVEDINISDHLLIYCRINLDVKSTKKVSFKYRPLNRINLVTFQTDLEALPWHILFETPDIDEKVNLLSINLLYIFDIHAPLISVSKKERPYCPWITDNIKLMKTLRNQALNRFRVTRNQDHWNYYKQLRNATTAAVRAEKKVYLNNKLLTCSTKEKWAELNKLNILNKKSNTIPEILKKPDELNIYFTQATQGVVPPQAEIIEYYENNSHNHNSFMFNAVSDEVISGIILNLKSKAFGSDNLNITLIIMCCPFIIPFITHIVNCCLAQSYFPKAWKNANVLPLPKKKCPTEFEHLRSISVLPTFSKVLERVMEMQMSAYVNEKNILPQKQSGFRKGFSCPGALSDISDDIVTAHDKGEATILVLLDYSKAFDMLQHRLLVAILEYIGFNPSARKLVSSFLSERSQQVIVDGRISLSLGVSAGVPQGSILGPLLYSIYTANFSEALQHCQYHMYADDTQLYLSFNPTNAVLANTQLNNDLESINKISKNHSLKINPSKTVAILFSSKNTKDSILNNIELRLNNNVIAFHESAKSLGLVLDSKLKFTEHVTGCLRKGFSMLKVLYSHRHYLSKETRKTLCDALVLSHCNYADTVYGPFLDSINKNRIQKLQNCCIRFICGIRRGQGVSHKLPELGWLNMANRRKVHSICFFFKIIKYRTPPYLYNKITFRTDVHNLNIRRRDVLTIPMHTKEFFKKSFSYNIASEINKHKIVNFNQSVTTLKKRIKTSLMLRQ